MDVKSSENSEKFEDVEFARLKEGAKTKMEDKLIVEREAQK